MVRAYALNRDPAAAQVHKVAVLSLILGEPEAQVTVWGRDVLGDLHGVFYIIVNIVNDVATSLFGLFTPRYALKNSSPMLL